jgi:hypothetical protein
MDEKHDVENPPVYNVTEEGVGSVEEVKRAKHLQEKNAVFRKMRRGEEWLDEKMGVESTGIDRIPEEDKQPPSIWNVGFLSDYQRGGFSLTMVVDLLDVVVSECSRGSYSFGHPRTRIRPLPQANDCCKRRRDAPWCSVHRIYRDFGP